MVISGLDFTPTSGLNRPGVKLPTAAAPAPPKVANGAALCQFNTLPAPIS